MITTPEAYVHLSADKKTLTFYYDTLRATRQETTWRLDDTQIEEKKNKWEESRVIPAWTGTAQKPNKTITNAIFDNSFINFLPTSTAKWFYQLVELSAIEGWENLNTSQVTDMNCMFYNCKALTSIELQHINTAKVTDMNCMFCSCEALKTLNLIHLNTITVTKMSR